jgi:hypothetical protein
MDPVFVRPRYVSKGREIDGVFLMDSFGMAGGSEVSWKKEMYTQDALQYLYWKTGLHCVAVQRNGAGYAQLLEAAYLMRRRLGVTKVQFCVIISMGNDVYGYASDEKQDEGIDDLVAGRVASGMVEVQRYSQKYLANSSLIVYGGASKTWKYIGLMASKYDQYVNNIVMEIRKYADAIKGLSLGVLDTVDKIGHVNISSLGIVVHSFVSWALMAKGLPWGGALYAPDVKSKL